MQVDHFPINQFLHLEKIIQDFILKSDSLADFVTAFPSTNSIRDKQEQISFSIESRKKLTDVLTKQNRGIQLSDLSNQNIQLLESDNAFTITTGHQLCLFTGPLYSIYKIASTIRLAQLMKEENPFTSYIPIFWMASEDHDVEEINHAFLFNKKIQWTTEQKGAVGNFRMDGIADVITELTSLIGDDHAAKILNHAYSQPDLAGATRFLINELFGQFGLLIIDGNDPELKSDFRHHFKTELTEQVSHKTLTDTNKQLASLGYHLQVTPREINLFYLSDGNRSRIEKKSDDLFVAVGADFKWNQNDLLKELEKFPQRFSPNVILRPVYQETILPNLVYIGGPGEIAYWLQLKSTFEAYETSFPILVLRDSALLMTSKMKSTLDKLGLVYPDLAHEKSVLEKRLINATDVSFDLEKEQINDAMKGLTEKLKAIDPTLVSAAGAELQKILNGLDNLEKKTIRSLKQKEEVKLNQLNKLLHEIFPEGVFQERHDNYFQYFNSFGNDFIGKLIGSFNPLKQELHIITD